MRVQQGETTPGVRHEEMGCGQREFSKVRQHRERDVKKWMRTTRVQQGETTLRVRREEMG